MGHFILKFCYYHNCPTHFKAQKNHRFCSFRIDSIAERKWILLIISRRVSQRCADSGLSVESSAFVSEFVRARLREICGGNILVLGKVSS